ncbi:hypothetical protein NFI96_033292, partial [Prochilodus magdalenae]
DICGDAELVKGAAPALSASPLHPSAVLSTGQPSPAQPCAALHRLRATIQHSRGGIGTLSLARDQNDLTRSSPDSKELVYLVQICCQGRKWIVRRSYEDFRVLDKHLHLCIYDRRFSRLAELPRFDSLTDTSEFKTFAVYKQIWLLTKKDMVEVVDGDKWVEVVDSDKWDADNINPLSQMLTAYLSRLSAIADNKINCGPALTWMEIDNKGNHLLVHDESSINVPAVAAAHVIKRYIAQAADELSFEVVGDIVSVIDMPPKEDTGWWRGKHGFQVGFFPCECVELISEKVPPHVTSSLSKPAHPSASVKPLSSQYWFPSVSKKHGKLITFLRTFMKSRPTKQKLKQRGILRERVFGCDLGEHLLNSGHDVPQVIKSCTEFIEKHGVVDGIYRLSGIASNIQKLRHEFDSEHIPDLTKDAYIQDIHSVGSLCKLYFRELPNPLLTYQLYDKFSDAVSAATDDERLVKIHDVIQQLPPPHYRTLEFLMRHLARMATFSYVTNMHCKNLAIVWAPNLLRSKQIESACFSGTSAFMEVRIQSVVVEFILNHVDVLFSPKLSTLIRESIGHSTLSRPKSLLVCSPSTKLLSLEEAQARTQAQLVSPVSPDSKYIEVGEGPGALQGKFHTIIEFPMERKKAQTKVKKSPVASWRSFFNMGKSSTTAKRKLHRHPSEPNEIKTMALPGGRGDTGTLRSAKSEESLSSHNLEGGSGVYRPRRPRSTSDALSSSFNEELLNSRVHRDFQGSQKDRRKDPAVSTSCVPALISPPHSADAVLGMASPDFDPLSFHCNAPPAETTVSDGKKRGSRRKNGGSSSELNKVTSDILTSDAIPKAKEDANHRQSSSGKFVPAIKAKVELESSESLPEGLAQNSEEALEMKGLSLPPTQEISPMIKPSESVRGDEGQYKPASSCQTTGENMDETNSEQAQPVKQAESGAVTFDCTPGLVRSVSLITPQPAVKSAARMLALALAESAQQATQLRKRGSSEPPTPISPVHLQDPLSLLQWPPPSSLQPQTSTKRKDHCANCKHLVGPSSTISTGSRTDAGSLQSTCACHGSESGLSYSDGGDVSSASHGTNVFPKNVSAVKGVDTQQAPESHVALKDNVRHVGVGTEGDGLCQNSEMDYKSLKPALTRTESLLHTTESQSATAALLSKQIANASNFRAILAEASMPASVHEVLPHVPVSPPSFRCSPKEENILKSSGHMLHRNWSGPVGQNTFYIQPDYVQRQVEIPSKDHYNTLAPRSLHQSIKYKGQHGEEYSPSHFYRHGGPRYPPMDGASVYPTIRRGSGPGAKTALMLKQSRSMVNYPQHILESQPLPRNLTLHKEYSCPDFKYTDPSEGSSARFHNQDKPMYKTLRSYPKEEYQYAWVKGHDLQRSERSQSVKSRQPPGRAKMTLERDHRLSYVSVQAKVPKPSRLATGVFPNYGCMPPHTMSLIFYDNGFP